jgi:hypothetical protein
VFYNLNNSFNIHKELENVKDIDSDSFLNILYQTRISNSGLKLSFLKNLHSHEFLSCDKISFLIPTFKDLADLDGFQCSVAESFFNYIDKLVLEVGGIQQPGNHTYKKIFMLNSGVHLSYRCRDGIAESVRFELNPNHVLFSDLCFFLKIFPMYRFNLIKITRFDVAIDYYHRLVSPELFVDSSSRRKRGIIMNGEKFETITLGSPNSPIHYTIYDKQIEMKRKNIDMPYCCRVEGKFKKEDTICSCFKNPSNSKIAFCKDENKFIYYGGKLLPFSDLDFAGSIIVPNDTKNEKILFCRLMSLNDISYLRKNLPRATFYRYREWFNKLNRTTDIIHLPSEIMKSSLVDFLNVFWSNLKNNFLDLSIEAELKESEKKGVPLDKF